MTPASSSASARGQPRASVPADGADLAELLRRSGLGDEASFAELYDSTSVRLFGLVLRVVRDPALSERVTQAAYVDVWRRSARFEPARSSALAWIMTIAHRTAVGAVR